MTMMKKTHENQEMELRAATELGLRVHPSRPLEAGVLQQDPRRPCQIPTSSPGGVSIS